MIELRILQVGDLHYPQAKYDLDYKDKAIPEGFAHKVASNPMRPVLNHLLGLADSKPGIDGILFCGDLTSWGDLTAYSDCVEWLERGLELSNRSRWPLKKLHCVPGNHDINRDLCKPNGSTTRKFKPLVKAWKERGCSIISPSRLRQSSIRLNGCGVRLISINSCLGCGEYRGLPEDVRKQIEPVLTKLVKSEVAKKQATKSLTAVWEQLDTPAFSGGDVDELVEVLSSIELGEVALVLTHHNLLPQAQARLDLYTEIINSGFLRQQLVSCVPSVIYCHGHIHEDPIELLRHPNQHYGPLVCVSAPEFREGYNLLRFFFGEKKCPLGLEIVPIRAKHGIVSEHTLQAKRISLQSMTDYVRLGHESISEVLRVFESLGESELRFNALFEAARKVNGRITSKRLADAVKEGEWFGILSVANREDKVSLWHVKRELP